MRARATLLINSQFGVVGVTGAHELAPGAVGRGVRAGALLAVAARPPLGARARAVNRAARPAVLAPAGLFVSSAIRHFLFILA